MAMDQESEKKEKTSQDSQPDLGSAQGRSEAGTRGVAPGNTRSTAEEKGPEMPQRFPDQKGGKSRWEKGKSGWKKRSTTPFAEVQEGQDEVVNQGQQEQSGQPSPEYKEVQDKVVNYGQQLRHERELRGWTQEELAKEIGVSVPVVQSWENDHSPPDLAFRQKLSQLLGNDFYLSSEVLVNGAHRVRIVQRQLAAQDFTAIIPALIELHIKCWLIVRGRYAELIEYAQTHNVKFAEEAGLVITSIGYSSPFEMILQFFEKTLKPVDPKNIMEAVVIGIDGVFQARQRLIRVMLDNQKRAQQIQQNARKAEQEFQRRQHELAIAAQKAVQQSQMERERLRHEQEIELLNFQIKREELWLELVKQQVAIQGEQLKLLNTHMNYVTETANRMVDKMQPNADPATRAMQVQILLPSLLQLDGNEGLPLALPTPQNS